MKFPRASAKNWEAKALSVAERVPKSRLHPAVRSWLDRTRMRGPWCVALSGGADSLALLLLLWAHWPERRERLVALHFNHRVRGAAADADERFCRRVAAGLRVRWIVGRRRRTARKASEADLRADRQAFFVRAMQRLGSRVLCLGHQQDDVAETMLMRLARGSGAGGLSAPRPIQEQPHGLVHLRPILSLGAAEIKVALQEAGVAWREDATNTQPDFFRNRIRQQILPAWRDAAGRDAVAGAVLAREKLEEDDCALATWVDRAGLFPQARALDVRACQGLPRAVVRRAVHRWLLAVRPGTDLSRQGFEQLLRKVEEGRSSRFSLGDGFAVIQNGRLSFRRH